MEHEAAEDRLRSWKAIAEVLGREVRTVQRWETSEGMPVHRQIHMKRPSVWAYKAELLKWQAERKELTTAPEAPSSAVLAGEESAAPETPAKKIDIRRSWWLNLAIVLAAV